MGILRGFERRLESLVEGFFARALPGGSLQPVELGKRLVRSMEDAKNVSVSAVYVPNAFTFRVSPKDHERLASLGDALPRELIAVSRRAAAGEGWTLLGPPQIAISPDDSVTPGRFEVAAEVIEGPDPEADAGAHTQLIDMAVPTDAELVVVGANKRSYPLSRDALVIGRMDTGDIVLTDAGASRKHCEVRREGDEWFVVDLGSTNGTLVNGKSIRRHRLANGDRLTIGETDIEFRTR
jgi:hypothetical protein